MNESEIRAALGPGAVFPVAGRIPPLHSIL